MAGEVERLQELVDKYDNIVFFGGAGVSTESGIPDFRSQDGLYHQKYDYPPETILSHTFFMRKPPARQPRGFRWSLPPDLPVRYDH